MSSNSQPAQSMDKPHPDEMVQARRERIKRARVDGGNKPPIEPPAAESVSVPIETWQEMVRLARLGQSTEAASPLEVGTEITSMQQRSDETSALTPEALEMRRLAAMVEALRRRPPDGDPNRRVLLLHRGYPHAGTHEGP